VGVPRLEMAEVLEEAWFALLNRAQPERLFASPEGWDELPAGRSQPALDTASGR
jgi:hypothetical protein